MDQSDLPQSLHSSLTETKVSYVQLGTSGLRVSVPILGGMSFGLIHLSFSLYPSLGLIEIFRAGKILMRFTS